MKRVALILIVLQAFVYSLSAADEDELKAVYRLMTEAAKTSNLELLASNIHPQALGFMRESQLAFQLKPGYGAQEVLPPFLADMSRFMATPYDPVFRVVGNTGIVCIVTRFTPISKSKDQERFNRVTWVFTKEDGKWKLLSWHTSETPLKKK